MMEQIQYAREQKRLVLIYHDEPTFSADDFYENCE